MCRAARAGGNAYPSKVITITGLALILGFNTGFALGLLALSLFTRLGIALCSQVSLFGNGVGRKSGVKMGKKIE